MEFKVGDKVQVVTSDSKGAVYKVGSVGMVTKVDSHLPYPYEVKVEGYDCAVPFLEKELEKV